MTSPSPEPRCQRCGKLRTAHRMTLAGAVCPGYLLSTSRGPVPTFSPMKKGETPTGIDSYRRLAR